MKVFWKNYLQGRNGEVYSFDITMRYFTFKRIENALKEHGCFVWGKAHNPIEVRKGQYDPETKTIVLHFWVRQDFESWSEEYGKYFDSSRVETCVEVIGLIGLAAQYERITEETYHHFFDDPEEYWCITLNFSTFH